MRGHVPSGTRRAIIPSTPSGVYDSHGNRSAIAARRPCSSTNPGFYLPARSAAPTAPPPSSTAPPPDPPK
ncbi:hypothetical protein, partial [Paramuribaculum intestinale]